MDNENKKIDWTMFLTTVIVILVASVPTVLAKDQAAFFFVSVIFLAMTYESASFTLASVSTQRLEAGENPIRWSRVFWACALGVLPITLMFVDGGLRVILSATNVVSLPLMFVGVIMSMSLLKMLKADVPA